MRSIDESKVEHPISGEAGQHFIGETNYERQSTVIDSDLLAILANPSVFVGIRTDCRVTGPGGSEDDRRCSTAGLQCGPHLPV